MLNTLKRRLTPTAELSARLLDLTYFAVLNDTADERERVRTYNELLRRHKLPAWAKEGAC